MFSWQLVCYKILLIVRFVQIFFFNGHRPFDDFSHLMENYLITDRSNRNISSIVTRSHLFPIISCEITSVILTFLRHYPKIVSPFFLTPFFVSRIFSFAVSLFIDFFLFRSAKYWRIKPNLVLFFYSSSYVSLVFFTFCRSCLFETVLLSALIYLVIRSVCFDKDDQLDFDTSRSNVHGHSHSRGICNSHEEQDDFFGAESLTFLIGFVFSLGISNRLNFFFFSLAPLVQWFLSSESGFRFFSVCRKIFLFLLGAVVALLFVSIIDSCAIDFLDLHGLSIDRFSDLTNLARNLTFASWNSFRLELSFRTIANRSTQPWYAHILINTPLMFGVFGFCAYLYFMQCFRLEILLRLHHINSKYWFFLSSFIVSLISLSIYPIKDAEDLCPLLVPLILIVVIRISQYGLRSQARLTAVWCAWNFIGLLYYGHVYNGQLFRCISNLENVRLESTNRSFAYHFFATDKPPSLAWFSHGEVKAEPTVLHYAKNEMTKFERRLKSTKRKFTDVYVIAPSSISLCHFWNSDLGGSLKLTAKYPWHFSPDAPPNFWFLFGCSIGAGNWSTDALTVFGQSDCHVPCMENKWTQLGELLTLKVYRLV